MARPLVGKQINLEFPISGAENKRSAFRMNCTVEVTTETIRPELIASGIADRCEHQRFQLHTGKVACIHILFWQMPRSAGNRVPFDST